MRRPRDDAVSSVVGALLVLAVLGLAIMYVNGVHVPQQGTALEVDARESAEAALASLGARLSDAKRAPLTADVPLKAERPLPPLLAGVILSPARAEGKLAFEPGATALTISHVTDAPPGGVPVGDPMRQDLGGGRMRVYDVGNASAGLPLGSLRLTVGGSYLDPATYLFEGGAVMLDRGEGSAVVTTPGLHASASGTAAQPTTRLSWRVPVLTGHSGEVVGARAAQLSLQPGPEAQSGGGQRVHNVTLTVATDAASAWKAALEDVLRGRGVVSVALSGPDSGVVTALVTPPAQAQPGVPSVEMDLSLVRYGVDFTARSGG